MCREQGLGMWFGVCPYTYVSWCVSLYMSLVVFVIRVFESVAILLCYA